MILVLDIGNTNITCGLYQNEDLIKKFRLISDKNKQVEEYVKELINNTKEYKVTGCIIGSVVDELNKKIEQACNVAYKIESFLYDNSFKTGILLDVEKPESVGVDRIANAYVAYKKYNTPIIVIDMGSATTFDIISNEGKFFGGIIMPGVEMQLNSLCEKTSKLPRINIENIESVIGRDTKTCILSGVIRGHACAIEGLINQCEKELSEKATIVVTGGLSSLLSKYISRNIDFYEPNLTLDGFRLLYELNKK